MMRRFPRLATGLILALLVTTLAQAAPTVSRTAGGLATRLSTVDLRQGVQRVLQARQVPAATREALTQSFEKLPAPAQSAVGALLDPGLAEQVGLPEYALGHAAVVSQLTQVNPAVIDAILRPTIDGLYPTGGGSPGQYCVVTGRNYRADSVVVLAGVTVETFHWGGNALLFVMPATAHLGQSYQVAVSTPSVNKASAAVAYKAVAPRGYRGVHGLSFPNFGAAAIPWSVYAFVFGQASVEFADGTHRPTAQDWYDDTFKRVGIYGNCWGMSQLSYRLRKYLAGDGNALVRVAHSDWVIAHTSGSVWSLPWDENSKQAVQSLQCLQLVDPMATYCSNQKASQDNNTAWDFADSNTPGHPVQNTLFGHAVISFNTETSGANRKFCFYDNNHPYAETETCGSDPDHGVTVSNTGTFSYGGYSKTRCYDPDQLMGVPTLPAGVGGDNAVEGSAGNARVRFEVPRVSGLVIQDEAGRGGADGAGLPGLAEITPDMGLGPVPATFPRLFLLSNPAGRRLSFTVPNGRRQLVSLACYARGGIIKLTANGATIRAGFGQFDQPSAQLTLPEPQASGLAQVRFLAALSQAEERSVLSDNWSGLGAAPLGLSLSADRGALEVLNAAGAPVQFRLQLQRHQPGALNSLPAVNQTASAGQLSRLGPANWNALRSGQLRLERLAIPPGRLNR